MVTRDTFIKRYAEVNNAKELETEVSELEKFVDDVLTNETVILNYVNQNGLAGTNGHIFSQQVTSNFTNNAVHRTPNILDNGSGRTGPNKEYAVWGNNLTTANNVNAATTPWIDLTIDTQVSGQLRVVLPETTNKNAAFMLVQKYLGPLKSDASTITQTEIETNGFWGRKPVLGSSGTSGAVLDSSAVTLEYDEIVKRFIMVFTI